MDVRCRETALKRFTTLSFEAGSFCQSQNRSFLIRAKNRKGFER